MTCEPSLVTSKVSVPAGASAAETSQASSVEVTETCAASPTRRRRPGRSRCRRRRTGVASSRRPRARGLRIGFMCPRRAGGWVSAADGRRDRGRWCGRAAPADRAEEEEHHRDDVQDPDGGLEHGRGGEKLKIALEQGGVPGGRVDGVGDVPGQVVEAGQDAGLLEVVDAVRQDAAGDQDQEAAGPGEERAEVDRDRAAVEQVAEHDGGGDAERGAEQRLPGRRVADARG